MLQAIDISVLQPGSAELAVCAAWRTETFAVLGSDADQERARLERFVADQGRKVALVAKHGGVPIGTCLLAPSEIDPNHEVTPWLGGLFVLPEHRRRGAGAALVRAIEREARQRDFTELFLYTTDAAPFYARLGWALLEHTIWNGGRTAFMRRALCSGL